jgi:hypothetical protein
LTTFPAFSTIETKFNSFAIDASLNAVSILKEMKFIQIVEKPGKVVKI